MWLVRSIGRLVVVAGLFLLAVMISDRQGHTEPAVGYQKIANDGTDVDLGTPLGSAPKDWACSRDAASGLMWEVKAADGGLRDRRWTYTPYNSNPQTNFGWIGYRDTTSGTCLRAAMDENSCNTEAYITAVNRSRLCGYSDWRLPTMRELVAVAQRTSNAPPDSANPVMLPNTADGWYWTGVVRHGATKFSRVVLLPVRGQPHFYDGSYMVIVVREAVKK